MIQLVNLVFDLYMWLCCLYFSDNITYPQGVEERTKEANQNKTVPSNMEIGSVIYNVSYLDLGENVVNIQLQSDSENFRLVPGYETSFVLETTSCLQWNLQEIVRFIVDIDNTKCQDFVQITAEPTVPGYVEVPRQHVDTGDCKPGRILDIIDLRTAMDNAAACVSFRCSIDTVYHTDKEFWIYNGTMLQTSADCLVYEKYYYSVKVLCAEDGADEDVYGNPIHVEIFFYNVAPCTETLITESDVSGPSSPQTALYSSTDTTTNFSNQCVTVVSNTFFDKPANVAGLAAALGYIAGAVTVGAGYMASRKLCKTKET